MKAFFSKIGNLFKRKPKAPNLTPEQYRAYKKAWEAEQAKKAREQAKKA